MREQRLVTHRLNLEAIESALKNTQRDFSWLNGELDAERSFLYDEILMNMMAGYAYVDAITALQIDLFAPGHSRKILELNNIVLYGTDPQRRSDYIKALDFNESHFYQQELGGVGDLIEAYRMHNNESVWKRAARVYIRILSHPQLFLEGNHRTGALLMSYVLVREGKPPFVLTVDNAKAYFDPSSLIRKSKKHSLSLFFRTPKLKNHFACLLKEQANVDYLQDLRSSC